MNRHLTAGDIMSRSVAITTPNASVSAAIRLMLERHVSGLPVLDALGGVVGILTEGDLLHRVELGTGPQQGNWLDVFRNPDRLARAYVETHSRIVSDIMTPAVVTVDEAASLSDVVHVMQGKHVKRVPVMSGSKLMGVVSRVDLVRTLASALAGVTAGGVPTDHDIRAGLLADLKHQSWAPSDGISVSVMGGVVSLGGTIFRESERAAIRVAAETRPGVTRVLDHMIWIEPNTGMTLGPT